MRWSKAFIPTLREEPAKTESVSHRLLLRAGMIRQVGSGIYSLLPLAQRVRKKIIALMVEEMNAIGGQEFVLPALNPADLWKASGRWRTMGDIMFRLKDRRESDLALAVTHEELFSAVAAKQISSYRQLPQIWYQVQTKFRDEPRPRAGLLRVREFTMKDSYSFDVDEAGLDRAFESHRLAYCRIFQRCGLKFEMAGASTGIMGGAQSTEFLVITDAGEDQLVICEECGYSANLEKAVSRFTDVPDQEETDSLFKFATPGIRTIEALSKFAGGAPAERQVKTLIYVAGQDLVAVLLRGDHELNVTALADHLRVAEIRPATADEVFEALGAHPGSLGAVNLRSQRSFKGTGSGATSVIGSGAASVSGSGAAGVSGGGAAGASLGGASSASGGGATHGIPAHASIAVILCDKALAVRRNMVTGANEDDFHYRGVCMQRDIFPDEWGDFRLVQKDDRCVCGKPLSIVNALEIGHIFKLGTKYSEASDAYVLTETGNKVPMIMGSYGIGVERLMAAIIEQSHDEKGIIWPINVAPFHIVLTPVNSKDEEQMSCAESLYKELSSAGLDVLLDDRDERAGVKFNDAELIGVPLRITFGSKLREKKVELFQRATNIKQDVDLAQAGTVCRGLIAKERRTTQAESVPVEAV